MYYSSRRLVIVLAVALAVALCLNLACVAAEDAGGGSSAGGGSDATDTPSVSQLLKEGTAALTTGRMGEAIAKFDAAIAAEPGNYLSYYRRATAYLSSGRTASALADLDKLLTLNPRFAQAHLQKGKTFAKDGDLDAAKKSIKEYLKLKKGDEEATTLSNSIDAALSNLKSLKSAHEYLEKSVKKGHDASSDSSVAARADDCLRYASQVLEVSPSLLEARRLRADCYLAKGDVENAVGDWT
ncbi:hypothetical protein L7F22_061657 [Adiantum nelumboides]|nr:hypothetical protein [Adiantum nelumboides]